MTEEQRMEEGRRMFQIFAARMFEQRVLTAYREKVAQERQEQLIKELDEESRLDSQRELKRQKEAAKKKEKKRLQKLVKEEEKAKKEAEKAAAEAAAREAEEKRVEEQRQRKEEQRKKREAEKKAAEEEKARKEAEKFRKAQEERDRQAEIERKQREAKEKEKKKREEARKREREEREAKEREAKERRQKEEAGRKAKEERARKEKEAADKAEREIRDRLRLEQAAKRPPVAVPPGLHPPSHPSNRQSPHFQVATPIIPKAPTPAARNRQTSQQGPHSHGSSPRSQQANTETSHSSASPASIALPQTPGPTNVPARAQGQPPVLHHPQPSVPLSPLNQNRAGHPQYNFGGVPVLGFNGPQTSAPGLTPGMVPPMPMYQGPPMGAPPRSYGQPGSIPFPPGIGTSRPYLPNAPHMTFHSQAPISVPQAQPPTLPSHSRQPSGSQAEPNVQPTPISRPAPIKKPSTPTPEKQKRKLADPEVDNLATHLGSKALLDDSDIPLNTNPEIASLQAPPGPPGSGRAPFSSFNESNHDNFAASGHNWQAFSSNVGGAANWGAAGQVNKAGGGWPTPSQQSSNAFGVIGGGLHNAPRFNAPRPVAVRLMLVQACRQLSSTPGGSLDGFQLVQNVLRQVDHLKPVHEPAVSLNEMLEICDTEGNAQNGGGTFHIRNDANRGQLVKFEPESSTGGKASAGDIGSPLVGHSQPVGYGGIGHPIGAPGKGF